MNEEYSVDEDQRVVTYKDSTAKANKTGREVSLVEKLIKDNDKAIKEEAKELKGILASKNYDKLETEINLIDNNLAVQGRKKYESKQHVQTDQQQTTRRPDKQIDMMQVLQDSHPQQPHIAKVNPVSGSVQPNLVDGVKLDNLKGRYNEPVKISKEDMMMIEESDEEQLFVTDALDTDENRRKFDEELEHRENEGKAETKAKELAGWGDWVGHGVKPKPPTEKIIEQSKKMTLNKTRTNIIVNDSLPKTFRKYMVNDLPHEYKNKDQFNFEVGLALGSEWNGLKNSKSFCKPKVMNNAGNIITPLDKKHLPKAKFL